MTDSVPTLTPEQEAEKRMARERIEVVALALCNLDDRPSSGIAWGAAVTEAMRYVAAFDALQLHARVVASFVPAVSREN